ncbi:spinster family MFS transporter [Croceicoccus bisphenolivorans]|uniref:spinster family MFS transporter n=1 Tax=Croceicoccus bisphenolivorans TaxID=1783232 RepID=UPI001FDEF2CB|nr:MFS transporter [Croceicoccus bisphenolivorans]
MNEQKADSGRGQTTSGYRYGWYTTAVLMVAYTFSFLDRQILNLMVGPIKADLGISDLQFAILTGGAFGIFYTIMGLPIGWLADRYPRKWIISGGIAAWSLMTVLCGLARTFPQLVLARIGVGVGEATLSPSAHSMLSDLFDKTRLPKAMSLYTIGIYIGAGIAMIVGGTVVGMIDRTPDIVLPVLGHMRSWHLVFIAVGLPGLLVALWVTTLREPERVLRHDETPESATQGFSLRRIWGFLADQPLMSVSLFLGAATFSVLSYTDNWFPELFIRSWGWGAQRTGLVIGSVSLVAGPLGMLAAGWWSSRMIERGQVDGCLRLTAYAAAAIAVPAVLMPLMPNPVLMAILVVPIKFFGGFTPVLIPAAIQMIAPVDLRAQLGAFFMFTVGIVGVSFGPILPAVLTDYVFKDEMALHFSLALTSAVVAPLAFLLLWVGMRQYRARLEALEAGTAI